MKCIILPFTQHTWHTDLLSNVLFTSQDDAVEADSSDIVVSETSIAMDELALK